MSINTSVSDNSVEFIYNFNKNLNKTNIDNQVIKTSGINDSRILERLNSLKYLNNKKIVFLKTLEINELNDIACESYYGIMNTHKINDARFINKYLEAINKKLQMKDLFIGCIETSDDRLVRIKKKFPLLIAYPYYTLTFILKRIFPKWGPTKKIYFFLTKGKNRYVSLAEVFGRLISCGFKIRDKFLINNITYFVVEKEALPVFDTNPTYGFLVKLKRKGKGGKSINVYKFRTMHPYSEYLQEYIYEKNKLQKGGKFNKDFRVTSWGKYFRKYWIDEIPMLINFFKRELKLVGVRPLSSQYLSLYREDLRIRRMQHKPGLFPPYYADLPNTLEEIMDSEEQYLKAYEANPFRTDLTYFFKICKNIIFKSSRSK